jgi:hypothetical protein
MPIRPTRNGNRNIRALGLVCILFFVLVFLFCVWQRVTATLPADSPASSLAPSAPAITASDALSLADSTPEDTSIDPFFAELDEADTAHVLEMLATADGAYTDACYARLASQLIQEPETTLQILLQNLQENPEEDRILQSLGKELYYVPQSEEKEQLHTFLSSMDASNAACELGRQILDAWDSE